MKSIKALLIISCIAWLTPAAVHAQERITGLTQNPAIVKIAKQTPTPTAKNTAVRLPFLDDFSNYTGYPDPVRWTDRQAFVNNTYPVIPPTLGVATLDALDANGRIYPQADRNPFSADTLTSQPIRLDSNFTQHRMMLISDSLYFSFYYQPGGASRTYPAVEWERIGDAPERDDRLILEFGYATGAMVFTGFAYGTYIIEDGQYYLAGDTIPNPFMPGCIYIFESNAYAGETIAMPTDSLFGPEYVWNEVWSTDGCSVDEWLAQNSLDYFKQVLIPITDAQYLRDNFQFRFRNYASLDLDSWSGTNIQGWASNCDQWHIDYVHLDVNRNANDRYPNDVAFASPTTSALKSYQSMPWNQFRASDMAAQFSNEMANISSGVKNTLYNYTVINKRNNSTVYTSTVNNENATPYYDTGLHTYTHHAAPDINFSFTPDGADSASFLIQHVFRMEGSNDKCTANDTCVFEQKFHNYYAYDDGTAEAGYCLLSSLSNPESYLAVQFNLAEPDTLQCVRMWFNHVLNNDNFANFTLMVWNDENGQPGEVLYELPAQLPNHADQFLDFVNYYPEAPIAVTGTFYVGFYQHHNVQLNLGFDQNNDARGHFFYKIANTWNESYYKGAPMIRPVLGKSYDHSGVAEHPTPSIRIYPNPTTGIIHLDGEWTEETQCLVYDICGKLIATPSTHNATLDLSACKPGVYFIKIIQQNQIVKTEKIIKR